MRTNDVEEAAALMKPAGEDVLQKWPVSKRINSPRVQGDDVTLIEKVDPKAEAGASTVTPFPAAKIARQRSLFDV